VPIYEKVDEDRVRAMSRTVDTKGRADMRREYAKAIDFAENRQVQHVRGELLRRFQSTQEGDPGQAIQPIAAPLTERYVAEAANAYNKQVTRTLVQPDGKQTDATKALTAQLQDWLDRCLYDERMHVNEQMTVLLRSSCVAYEAKRGMLRPAIKFPHDIYPVLPTSAAFVETSDPEDYDAFIIETYGGTEGVSTDKDMRTFAVYTNAEVQFWLGKSPDALSRRLSTFDNPYRWKQPVETIDDRTGTRTLDKEKDAPGRMLTFWHLRYPLESVVAKTDVDIVQANLELNCAWASLLHTIKVQGHAVPVITGTGSKSDTKGRRRYGALFPLELKAGESFELASAASTYSQQVEVLKAFVQMMAVFKRQSPSDFSMDAAAAVSGFAKVVDSLPKLEARAERVRRLKAMEEQEAWPRIRAIGIMLGELPPEVAQLKLQVSFADVEFPLSEDEKTSRLDREVKHGLTSVVRELAKRDGISLEEAEQRLKENTEKNATVIQQPPNPMAPPQAQRPPLGDKTDQGERRLGDMARRRERGQAS
jgi:hypothetical protein